MSVSGHAFRLNVQDLSLTTITFSGGPQEHSTYHNAAQTTLQPLTHTLTRASAPTTDSPIPTPSLVYTIIDMTGGHNLHNENGESTITIDATTGVMTIPAIISDCALKTYTFRVELSATFGVYNEGSVVGGYEL